MAHSYTPGLKVTNCYRHRTKRILPIAGEVRVAVGDKVSAQDVVAETFMPGDITPINLSNLLSLSPSEVKESLLKKMGDQIEIGDVIARSKGIFGFLKQEYASKVAGKLESVSDVTGQVILRGEPLPIQVQAFLSGEVVEVFPNEGVAIEAEISYVQGIFGIGGEAYGQIKMVCQSHSEELTEFLITDEMQGMIIIGGARMTGAAVRKAIDVGVAAVVSGGMDDHDLKEILGYDLGVAITGTEKIGTTIIITEGFGEISMAERTFQLLKSREGAPAAINGATQIRAGVMRPEILIPMDANSSANHQEEKTRVEGLLDIGAPVRIIRDPYFGILGTVVELPHEQQVLGSESHARVLKVQLESGDIEVVPRANVELIET
ncbi:FIG00928800: hypothetical protein [hydrothermal vent metagenome]|uniref:KOW domain-containing protein n=1 Tax=hydrothermal vent metagenome TaxID=652676 RepID=A0A3B1D2V9_9ZZZZ